MNCTDSTRVKRIIYVAIQAQWDLNTKACAWKEKRICSCDTLGNLKNHNSRDSTWQEEDSKHDTCTNLAPLVDFETQMERQTGTKPTETHADRFIYFSTITTGTAGTHFKANGALHLYLLCSALLICSTYLVTSPEDLKGNLALW